MVETFPNRQLGEWFDGQVLLLENALREGDGERAAKILAKAARKYNAGVAERLRDEATARAAGDAKQEVVLTDI